MKPVYKMYRRTWVHANRDDPFFQVGKFVGCARDVRCGIQLLVCRRKILLTSQNISLLCNKNQAKTQPMKEIVGIATNTISMGLLMY